MRLRHALETLIDYRQMWLDKNLNDPKTQTQEFFAENSKHFCSKTQEIGNFWEILSQKSQFLMKIKVFEERQKYSMIFPKLKNSRFRNMSTIHLLL